MRLSTEWPKPRQLPYHRRVVDSARRGIRAPHAVSEERLGVLLERNRSGDERALEDLMVEIYPSVYRFIWRLSGHDDEDLVQASLEQICRSIARFEGRSRVMTFIY